ncbi:MAG: hypothetical protein ACRYFS_17970 [Janthinobacterium lividum]
MNSNNDIHPDLLQELFKDGTRLDYLAKEAVRDALREHKRLGQSVAVWQDGKVVILAPEDIPVDFPEDKISL